MKGIVVYISQLYESPEISCRPDNDPIVRAYFTKEAAIEYAKGCDFQMEANNPYRWAHADGSTIIIRRLPVRSQAFEYV